MNDRETAAIPVCTLISLLAEALPRKFAARTPRGWTH